MRHHGKLLVVVGGALLASAFWFEGRFTRAEEKSKAAAPEKDKAKPTVKKTLVRAFMRKKLAAAQSVLEGLAVEDFALIAEGAKELKATAGAAEFMVSNDAEYVAHADGFRRVVNKLAVAAKEKRLDGSTLAYLDMTMGCVECHKYVRNAPIKVDE